MDTSDKCKNCGGEYGLHHYQTNQCPVNGREAPVGRKQEWKTTIFELDDTDELGDLRKQIARLQAERDEAVKLLQYIADSQSSTHRGYYSPQKRVE